MGGARKMVDQSAAIDLIVPFPMRPRHEKPFIQMLTAAHRCATIRARNRMNGFWLQTVRGK
jgi:hypothetical protein